ncbi:MAG TPA: DinB family protein [Candidatus Acidoferrales bacterium]|nr:DinB family protein [Candidatus Acidoferrales bacterium]
MDSPSQTSPDDLIVLLSTVPERVGDLVGGLDRAQLGYRHGPGFPSLEEVIIHLTHSGPAVDGLLRGLSHGESHPIRLGWVTQWNLSEDGDRPVSDRLEDFARLRRRTVDLLRGFSAEDWTRTVEDEDRGETSIAEVCFELARHELGHLTQVRNLMAVIPDRP